MFACYTYLMMNAYANYVSYPLCFIFPEGVLFKPKEAGDFIE
jgi:hypothetical protein